MATVIPKYNRIVQDQPQQAFYMVSIDTSGFLDTETNNGGRVSPCVAEDFATAPTTLAQSRLVSRGALRYKNRTIGEVYAHDLIIRATKAGALPKSKIIDVVNQWESSDHPEFWDRNVNSLYNAFTEVYKGNLVQLPNRSDALHSVFDNFVDFKIDDHVENTLDMEVVEGELVEV